MFKHGENRHHGSCMIARRRSRECPEPMMRTTLALLGSLLASVAASDARADPPCGTVEFRFQPGAHGLQIAVWVEDANKHVLATPYITRLTGQFGLGNRPGEGLLKTACGWPYGRREMVLPV